MLVEKILNILIGLVLVLVMFSSTQLASLYFWADESLAQNQVVATSSHPLINGQQVDQMPDTNCLTCHWNLP